MAGPLRARRDVGHGRWTRRYPPHSVEAEQAVLGGLLHRCVRLGQRRATVVDRGFLPSRSPADFRCHRRAGRQWQALRRRHRVRAARAQRPARPKPAAWRISATLARDTPTAANVRAYAEIVRERSLLRRLIQAGSEIAGLRVQRWTGTRRAIWSIEAEQQRIRDRRSGVPRRATARSRCARCCRQLIDKIDEWHYQSEFAARVSPTGFTDFDKITGGLRGGDLVIVAGRPSMGKTTLAVNMAEYAAVNPETCGPRSRSSAWKCPPSR